MDRRWSEQPREMKLKPSSRRQSHGSECEANPALSVDDVLMKNFTPKQFEDSINEALSVVFSSAQTQQNKLCPKNGFVQLSNSVPHSPKKKHDRALPARLDNIPKSELAAQQQDKLHKYTSEHWSRYKRESPSHSLEAQSSLHAMRSQKNLERMESIKQNAPKTQRTFDETVEPTWSK